MSSDAGRWPKYRMICGAYKETSFFSSSGVPINIAYTHTHGPYSWRQVLGQQSIFSCSSLLVRKRFFEKKKDEVFPPPSFSKMKGSCCCLPVSFFVVGGPDCMSPVRPAAGILDQMDTSRLKGKTRFSLVLPKLLFAKLPKVPERKKLSNRIEAAGRHFSIVGGL